MRGIEKQVLSILKELKEANNESIAFKLGISAEYVAQICFVLVKDGYIEEKLNGKIKLTLKGKEVTSPLKVKSPVIGILKGGR